MRKLDAPAAAASWLRGHVAGTLQTDSRQLSAGDGFIAWPGASNDARAFVDEALVLGAAACLVEHAGVERFGFNQPAVASYCGLEVDCGLVAAEFFGHPSHELELLAVTGTNGKTSTVWWLAQALSSTRLRRPIPCAMAGTLGIGRAPAAPSGGAQPDAPPLAALAATGLTTPDAVLLQRHLRAFVDTGMKACAIEASSIGIDRHRLDGSLIRTAIFTNFTQDHLDYHGTMEAYWQAKLRLFQWPGLGAAVVNVDDPKGAQLARALAAGTVDLWTVSCLSPARLRASEIRQTERGLRFDVHEGDNRFSLDTALIGQYNISNLLGVIAAMRTLGVGLADAVAACHDLAPVPGRMQCVNAPGKPLAVVDYAHTPDALSQALAALRPLTQARGGHLWCVFGCGGDRDPVKRGLMGAVAAERADHVIVTSDNPRSEDPLAIMRDILRGLAGHAAPMQQPDRGRAITQALQMACDHDVVLVAGKGHEDYQEVAGARLPFSDLARVQQALAVWQPSAPSAGATACRA